MMELATYTRATESDPSVWGVDLDIVCINLSDGVLLVTFEPA